MGCEQSRPSSASPAFRAHYFRDNAKVSWFVTDIQWRKFVEQTYTPEFCATQKVDCYEIWKDLQQTEVDDRCIIGRMVCMGPDYVSYGRVLVTKDYWHSYEGVWSTSATRFSSEKKQEFRVQIPEEGGLTCTCIDTGAVVWKRSPVTCDASSEEEPVDSVENAETEMKCKAEKGGDVQVLLDDQWVPGELRFHNYEELSIIVEGETVGTFKRELAQIEPEHKQFEGEDWVFGNMTPGSEVLDEKNARFMMLHLCRVDQAKGILQVVCSLGRSGNGRIGAITVPIPEDKLKAAESLCNSYYRNRLAHVMQFEGETYKSTDAMLQLYSRWCMYDLALRMSPFALSHYAVVYGAGVNALATGVQSGLEFAQGGLMVASFLAGDF